MKRLLIISILFGACSQSNPEIKDRKEAKPARADTLTITLPPGLEARVKFRGTRTVEYGDIKIEKINR